MEFKESTMVEVKQLDSTLKVIHTCSPRHNSSYRYKNFFGNVKALLQEAKSNANCASNLYLQREKEFITMYGTI
jgi:predicted ABC-type exoprotein transport system permease subunit